MGFFDKVAKGMDTLKEKAKNADTEGMLNKVKDKVKEADAMLDKAVNKVQKAANRNAGEQNSEDDYVVIPYEEALRLLMTPGELSDEDKLNVENAIIDAPETTGSEAKTYLANALGKFKGILLDSQEPYDKFAAATNHMASTVLLAAIEADDPTIMELVVSVMNSPYIQSLHYQGIGFGKFAMNYLHREKEEPKDGMDAIYIAHAYRYGWGVDIDYEKSYKYLEASKPLLCDESYGYIDKMLAELKTMLSQ